MGEKLAPGEIKKDSLEVTTAKSVVTLFIAIEQLSRARNPELASQLALQRNLLTDAINSAVQEE